MQQNIEAVDKKQEDNAKEIKDLEADLETAKEKKQKQRMRTACIFYTSHAAWIINLPATIIVAGRFIEFQETPDPLWPLEWWGRICFSTPA